MAYDPKTAGSIRPTPADRPPSFARRAATVTGPPIMAWIVGILLFSWLVGRVFLLGFAGFLVAVFLQALSQWISRHLRLPYGLALVIVVFLLIGLIGASSWLVGTRLAEQISQLSEAIPTSMEHVREQLRDTDWASWAMQQLPEPKTVLAQVDVLGSITGITSGAVNAVVGFVVIVIVGLYGAAQPEWYRGWLARLVPPARRNRAGEVMDEIGRTLRWWVVGQVLAMIVIGLFTTLGLWALGIEVFLALGLLAFLLEIIPTIGPIVAAIPAILLAWAQGPTQAFYVALLYMGVHVIEGYVLMPLIQSQITELPPAVQILSVLFLGILAGFLGAAVAAPLVIAVIVLVQMLYVEDTLGDRSNDLPQV